METLPSKGYADGFELAIPGKDIILSQQGYISNIILPTG